MRPSAIAAALSLGRLRQRVFLSIGWTIFIFGVIVTPVPGPGGFPIMLIGGIIILRNSDAAKRRFVRWKRRYPKTFGPVERLRLHLRRRRQAACAASPA